MTQGNAIAMIAAADIRPKIKNVPDLIARIAAAFDAAQDFYMTTDDDTRFRGALAAVLLETPNDADKERVIASKKALDKLDAIIKGSQAGLVFELSENDMPRADNIPLLKMWHDAVDRKSAR